MELREIKDLSSSRDIERLYIDSFIEVERVDFNGFFSGVFKGFQLYGFYKDKQLIGMLHFKNSKNFVHLNYMAVDKSCQSMGYGSQIIDWVKKRFNNKAIVVDVEEIEDNATNYEDRVKRKKFYYKNGFVDGKYTFMWEGVFMTYMHTQTLNGDEFMEYIRYIFPTIKDVKEKHK